MTRQSSSAALVALGVVALGAAALSLAACSRTDGAAPSAGASATRTVDPSPIPVDPRPDASETVRPPSAGLAVPGQTTLAGALGSWTLDGRGADSPWLPATTLTPIDLLAGTPPMVSFGAGLPIGAWQAVYAAAADPAALQLNPAGGREVDRPALASAALQPLPVGEWVLSVRLSRADGRGDATFFWLARVH